MKKIIFSIGFLFLLFLAGCLDDNGNYTYEDLNAPIWGSDRIQVTGNEGDITSAKSNFYFEGDSVERLAAVRYEWTLNGKVIAETRDLHEKTEVLMERAGVTEYPEGAFQGYFFVIEKETGLRFMNKVSYQFRPKFFRGDWLVISEDGNNTKLSFVKKKTVGGEVLYDVRDGLYKELNGADIPGKPRRIRFYFAKNIAPSVGAATVLTDKGGYEINCSNMLKAHEYTTEFLDGLPTNFSPIDVFHCDNLSLVATEEGKIYRRVMSDSWLGGQYITESYSVDSKGCVVTKFGLGANSSYETYVACYDELNRRILMIRQTKPYTIVPVQAAGAEVPLAIWDLEEGTEVLHLGQMVDNTVSGAALFTLVYNQGGKTYWSDFFVNTGTMKCVNQNGKARVLEFPGGVLDKDSRFITVYDRYESVGKVIFYSKGNEIRYVNNANNTDNLLMSFADKVTMMRLTSYNYNYGQIAVGLENGDFMMVDISSSLAGGEAKVYESSRKNLGGRIVDAMEIRSGGYNNF